VNHRFNLKRYSPLLLTILAFALIYAVGKSYPEENIKLILRNVGVFGPLVFIFLTLITYIIAPLSGSPLLFIGFYLFGQQVVVYSVIAAFISSIINFWISRYWGRSIAEKLTGRVELHKVDKFTQSYGLLTLFLLRVFQSGIHDFVSYAAGLTKMKFSHYFLVSTAGMVPGTLLWYILASKVNNPVVFVILNFSLIFFFSFTFLVGSFFLKKMKRKR
jgi:uncharacterized membrane protein YdjX (TVP38/TMEM64 family)